MSGITEILLIVAIVVAIVFLPRLVSRKSEGRNPHAREGKTLSGGMRLAVLLSLLWPAGCAFIMEPWGRGLAPFLYLGLAPVALLWAAIWVIKGFREAKR